MPEYSILARLKIDTTAADAQLKNKTYNLKANTNPEAIKKMKTATDGLTGSIGSAISKMALWAVAGTMLYGSLRQIEDGIKYVEDLNKVMTNIQIVTGDTAEGIQKLAKSYNDLAMATGTETLAVAEGSLEWIRQGKTVEETSQLIKDSMMMSKLANMDSAQATEYLTSIMNGFKLEANDMIGVLDKLVAIDNSSATSVAELSSAMQRSAVSAQLAGVSLDELAAYVGTVSSVSRKSAESIGESFKTIFARMQSVKAGANLDEFGDSLNNVEKTLKSFNIELRDSPDHFKDLDVVLSEVAGKWDTLENTEKSEIATAIAGVRQRENFLILMENWNQVLANQAMEADAAGLATERYGIYMDSIEAKMNQFKTAWQDMWSDVVSSDAIKDIVDFGTKIIELIDKMGGLVGILKIVIPLIIAFKAESAWAAISSSAFSLGIGSLVSGLTSAIPQIRIATLETLNLKIAQLGVAAAIYASVQAVSEYLSLLKQIKEYENQISVTTGEGISKQESTEGIVKVGSAQGAILNKNLGGMLDNQRINTTNNLLMQVSAALLKTTSDYGEYKNALDEVALASGYLIDEQGRYYTTIMTTEGSVKKYIKGLDLLTQAEYNQNNILAKTGESLSDAKDAFGEAKDGSEAYAESQGKAKNEAEDFTAKMEEQRSAAGDLSAAVESLISSYDAQKGATQGNVAALQKLLPEGENYLNYLSVENGKIIINIPALKALIAKRYDDAIATLNQARAEAIKNKESTVAIDQEIELTKALKEAALAALEAGAAAGSAASGTSALADAAKEAYQAEIDGYEKQKKTAENKIKALEKLKDAYADIIDAKKESLRLDKEEADYKKGLDARNKELADIDKELLQLQFDNSEEANARRLELENERAEKSADIEEYQADRAYDIQIEALEKEQEAYEKMIDAQIAALEKMISKYDVLIAKINEMIDALGRVPSGGGGSGGATPTTPTSTPKTTDTSKLKQAASTGTYTNKDRTPATAFASGGAFSVSSNAVNDSGIVRVDANEVGTVLNKSQISATAPLAGLFYSIMKSAGQSPSFDAIGGGIADNGVSVSIGDIVVQGNLDKVTLADVQEVAVRSVVTALKKAGIARSATKFSI